MVLFIPTKQILSTSTMMRRRKMEVVTRQLFLARLQRQLTENPASTAETAAETQWKV